MSLHEDLVINVVPKEFFEEILLHLEEPLINRRSTKRHDNTSWNEDKPSKCKEKIVGTEAILQGNRRKDLIGGWITSDK